MFEAQIWKLGEKELPGPACWNSMARFLQGMQSPNNYLILNTRPGGGVYFEVNIEAIMNAVQRMIESAEEQQDGDFDPTKANRKVVLPRRKVYLYNRTLTVPKQTITISGANAERYVWVQISKNAASYRKDDDGFPKFIDIANGCLNWPICILSIQKVNMPPDEKDLKPFYYVVKDDRHVGDIMIPTMPHFMLDGFAPSEFRVRVTSGADEYYYKPEDCED